MYLSLTYDEFIYTIHVFFSPLKTVVRVIVIITPRFSTSLKIKIVLKYQFYDYTIFLLD